MYKPAAKRRWGYFALPVLHSDRLVGKVDAVADRKASVLRLHAIHEDVKFGRAGFELDGESVDAPAGTLVFAKPAVKRTAFAEEPGTTLVAIGATAGEAYEPFGWELWAPLQAGFQAGNYDEVADRGNELIEAN